MYTPEHAGGLALPRLDASLIVEELAKGCTTTAAFLTIHNMATNMIGRYCQQEVIDEWCPDLVSGAKLASYCLTEPGAGSDAAALRTRAVADGDYYIINGSKAFISGAGETDVLVLMMRTGDNGPKGVTAILVPADADGISYGKNEHKMGWNAQPTRAITFDDVRVPKKYRLGEEGQGFSIAMDGLDGGRINIATCSVGTAQKALEDATAYVQERKQFGQAIADFQATQFALSDMLTELVAARQMVRLAASKLDIGDGQAGTYCAMAKRFATDAGFKVCNDALQLLGGYGYLKEYPMERYVRDTRVHQILEGTNQIMRVIISRRMFMAGALEVIQ
jgi:alkylation response protein AidB-like acyl-CoA dehydrogenase